MKYSNLKLLLIIGFSLISISCNNSESNISNSSKNIEPKINITNKIFSFGPALDTVNAKISAECDCCGSDFYFNQDNSFIIASYCLEGDSYSKGTYEIKDKEIILTFTLPLVTLLHELGEETDTTNKSEAKSKFEISKDPIPKVKIGISFFKSKLLLTIIGNDENEYGMENIESSPKEFISNLKKDGIWNKLGLH
jgi:hypothetical protein